MNVIINQFAGLGDILFIEPIYRYYFDRGFTVIAPINPDNLWIQEYIPYVEFKDKTKFRYDYESPTQKDDGQVHVPLRFAHPLLRGYDLHYGDDRKNWMPDKYTYLGLPVEMWRTLKFKRNMEREQQLFDWLGLEETKYDFFNSKFGGSFETIKIPNSKLIRVDMRKIEGFTLLDWGMVIENAQNIHTVETSIIYYIESLNCKATEKHLYPRMPWLPNVEYMMDLLGETWIYHNEFDLI